MRLSPKQRLSITHNLRVIAQGLFDENHIKTLLIDIREFVPHNSFIRELGHFMAHYERNSGKYHSLFNLREATIALLSEDDEGHLIINFDINRIHQDVYNTVFITGLDHYHKHLGADPHKYYETNKHAMDENIVTEFLKRSYVKTGKYYTLNDINAGEDIKRIAINILCCWSAGIPLISQEDLVEKINDEVKRFCNLYFPKLYFGNAIRRHGSDVMLCIMSLLQNASFILFDDAPASFELRIIKDVSRAASHDEILSGMCYLVVVGGRLKDNLIVGPTFFMISTHEPLTTIAGVDICNLTPRLPPLFTSRNDNGQLRLVPYSE